MERQNDRRIERYNDKKTEIQKNRKIQKDRKKQQKKKYSNIEEQKCRIFKSLKDRKIEKIDRYTD